MKKRTWTRELYCAEGADLARYPVSTLLRPSILPPEADPLSPTVHVKKVNCMVALIDTVSAREYYQGL